MAALYAISDIHGCFTPFHELVVNILRLRKSDRLILLGDYIDRGNQSREVIDFIMDLIASGFNVTPLKGNHELMLTEALHNPVTLPLWMMNSGQTTLQSFGAESIRDIPPEYIEYIEGLGYYHKSGDFIFVHAGFNDNLKDPFSDRYTMVWESGFTYKNPLLSDFTIIHGHRPKSLEYIKKQIKEKSKVIPIDSGCVYGKAMGYGFLSALEVNSMNLISVPCDQ